MKQRDSIDKFVGDQLSTWPLACANFRALHDVEIRTFNIGGLEVKLQFNPARIGSSAAKTDKASLKSRPCFLCPENRFPEQFCLGFEGRKGKKYDILLNPFPIFPAHLVIASSVHTPQTIAHRFVDILDLAKAYQDFTFFYNGPKCGASAPDHLHFQGTHAGLMPLENDVEDRLEEDSLPYLTSIQDAKLYHYDRFSNGVFVIRSRTSKSAAKLFYRLLDCSSIPEGDVEPRINLFTMFRRGEYHTIVFFRTSHRSHHYFSTGADHLTMSPGCADLGGIFISPIREEFDKMTPELLGELLAEVTISKTEEEAIIRKLTRPQQLLSVGIMAAPEISFEIISDGAGLQKAIFRDGRVDYNGVLYDELVFDSQTPSTMFAEPSFILHDVVIGKNFHWERRENQKFAGSLKIIASEGNLLAINLVGLEDYLVSVISSEMKSTASLEFLKAHAVISRSWVMTKVLDRQSGRRACPENWPDYGPDTIIRWYDHDGHDLFDVCADDHCQRYQGLTRAMNGNAVKAVDETWGEVLKYGSEICDARFSKCCGGSSELFSSCWADEEKHYLQSLPDTPGHDPEGECYCNTDDKEILSQVLNDYDLETGDFFEWKEEIPVKVLGSRILRKTGIKIGDIVALRAIATSPSGRTTKLLIEGSKRSITVGKELEIRRVLSESHLKSSRFEAEVRDGKVIINGRGWGHGVGLCQIGAAVMASKGAGYREILSHYYIGTRLEILDV